VRWKVSKDMPGTEWRSEQSPSETLRQLYSRLIEGAAGRPDPDPRFSYRVAWSLDYDLLFRGLSSDVTDVSELQERANRTGRVILCARGGGAKTVILHRLAKHAVQAGDVPVLVNLKKWTEPLYKRWADLREDGLERAAFLLAELSEPRITLHELESLPTDTARIILVDGLNEVRLRTGNSILAALDSVVRRSVNTCTIVTDRLVRRDLSNAERWQLATVQPLTDDEIRRHVKARFRSTAILDDPQTRALLSTPYFLDVLLREGSVAPSGSQAIRDYFVRHMSLTASELASAGLAAFRAYGDDRTRVFSTSAFAGDAGELVWQKLRGGGAVVAMNGTAYFTHHLKHDYLASLYVSANRDRWEPNSFGIITLGASSFDAVALALEQLETSDEADLFVRRVYDWNPYAAAYATAEGLCRMSVKVSQQMQVVLLAMLGERRWDLIEMSAQRAVDALSIFPGDDARRIREADSLDDIFKFLEALPPQPAWFARWRSLFSRTSGTPARDEDLALLTEPDSIIGWTSANVLKRLALTQEQLGRLRMELLGPDPTTRWRIAHVLGAFPTPANAEALLTVAQDDANEWARYGAIRSLVELAALSPSEQLRQTVFTTIAEGVTELIADRRRLEEFERAIFIRKDRAPGDWVRAAGTVVQVLYSETVDRDRREHWMRLAHALTTQYQPQSPA
jgi:hypothetical protein